MERGCECGKCVEVAQDHVNWWALELAASAIGSWLFYSPIWLQLFYDAQWLNISVCNNITQYNSHRQKLHAVACTGITVHFNEYP